MSEDISIHIRHLAQVDSTNTELKRNVNSYPDGTLLYADSQTAGRGRLDRSWVSPAGKNFYGSLLLKKLDNPFYGTMAISLAAMDVLKTFAPELPVWLKWPNDLYIADAKLAGVLSETAGLPDGRKAIIAGLGVNLNMSAEELRSIGKPAASVWAAAGIKINPENFAYELAKSAKMYYIMGISCSDVLFDQWRRTNGAIGLEVELELAPGRTVTGTAVGIADDGALIVRDGEGAEKSYYSGDVSITRESVSKLARKLRGERS